MRYSSARHQVKWTQEMKDHLIKLWRIGYTGSEIAEKMTKQFSLRFTANQVGGMRNTLTRKLGKDFVNGDRIIRLN